MSYVWAVVLAGHVLAMAWWVGGQLLLRSITPSLREALEPRVFGAALRPMGQRFTRGSHHVAWPLLLVTGVLLAVHDHVLVRGGRSALGVAFGLKMVVVVGLVAASLAHGRAARARSERAGRYARLTLVLSLVAVGLGALLASLPAPGA